MGGVPLIDEFLPQYDVAERHSIVIRASAQATYDAIRTADLAAALPVRTLLAIRALPGALAAGLRGLSSLQHRRSQRITLADFERARFSILAENPPHEMLIGIVGAFWTSRGGLCDTDAEHFRGPQETGTARAAWNFTVADLDDGHARLSTETRVQAADPKSLRRFRTYWLLVRPGSGLIRRYMLKAIRDEAEGYLSAK